MELVFNKLDLNFVLIAYRGCAFLLYTGRYEDAHVSNVILFFNQGSIVTVKNE